MKSIMQEIPYINPFTTICIIPFNSYKIPSRYNYIIIKICFVKKNNHLDNNYLANEFNQVISIHKDNQIFLSMNLVDLAMINSLILRSNYRISYKKGLKIFKTNIIIPFITNDNTFIIYNNNSELLEGSYIRIFITKKESNNG